MKRASAVITTAVLLAAGLITAPSASAATAYHVCSQGTVAAYAVGSGTVYATVAGSSLQAKSTTMNVRVDKFSSTPTALWSAGASGTLVSAGAYCRS